MLDLSRLSCLGEALRDATVTYKSNVALIEADRHRENARFSYRELRAEAERITARLQSAGVEPGDRCAILMSNQARWVISGLGALWAGATLVPLDYKLSAKEQLALLAHAQPKVLFTEHNIWRTLAADAGELAKRTLVVVSEAPADAELGGAVRFEERAQATARYVQRQRGDLACIVYSSGTGGVPKGCMLTHDNYLEQAQVLGRMYPMAEDETYFSILPTNHAIDFMCGMIVPFLFGASVVHQRTLRPEFLAPTMARYRVTHTALVPRILKALRERIEEQIEDAPEWKRTAARGLLELNDLATMRAPRPQLSRLLLKPIHDRFGGRLKLIIAGGAFVDPDLAEFFYRIGLPVVIGYGLTEAGTALTLNDLSPFRADTVGRPVDGVELVLRDRDADGVGELWVRSRTVMQGYLDAPELTREAIVDGWLRTGDLGVLDASGHLHLRGRAKNMIVTAGGKNIYPEDVEAAFESVPCEELCVFAERYVWPKLEQAGEKLCLVLRLRKEQTLDDVLPALREANQRLAEHKRIASYLVETQEYPRTASMKLKRDVLAARLRESGTKPLPLTVASPVGAR
jgi:long-chain acyl-CoA synthetase